MRYYILLFVLLTFFVLTGHGQNHEPIVTNLKASINESKKQIIVTYDVSDQEGEKIDILFKVSSDGGNTYLVNTKDVQGDVGFPVIAGKNKKIVWHYPEALNYLEKLKIKLIADDLYKINILDLVNQVDSQFMKNDMTKVYGIRSHTNKPSLKHLEKVRMIIGDRFASTGLQTYRLKTTIQDNNFQSVIGRKQGNSDEGVTYILSAHMDTEKKSPGADDNGSGVVGMMEAVRILSKYQFKKSIKFIGFDGEEVGHVGSKIYINHRGIKDYEKIEGVINYDMIGYYSTKPHSQTIPDGFEILFPEVTKSIVQNKYRGDFVVNTSNTNSRDLGKMFSSCAGKYVPQLKVVSLEAFQDGSNTPDLTASDHYQFWKKKINALHIGDGGETRNPNLDTRKDLIHLLNFTFMSNVVKATIATLAELAEIQHCSVSYANISPLAELKR
jgi:Peptidase family M28